MTRLETALIVTVWSAMIWAALWTWEIQLAGQVV